MLRIKRNSIILFLALALFLSLVLFVLFEPPSSANASGSECQACHAGQGTAMTSGKHTALTCELCHEGSAAHLAAPNDAAQYPTVHFDNEICQGCHPDQYNTFEIAALGRTYYGGSDEGPSSPKGWSKTLDLPYWNVLIDGHPFVQETYEDAPMALNQIQHQETIRPGSEACLECHGTKVAYYMGITYTDAAGATITIPAKERLIRNQHTIYDGTSHRDPATGEWTEDVTVKVVPAGTKITLSTDGVTNSLYEVKTFITLGAPVTEPLPGGGSITFTTIASYDAPTAQVTSHSTVPGVAALAKEWIYCVGEALAFDGLDYYFNDPQGLTTFTGGGYNWPSIQAGELCNQCHDPMSTRLRLVKKSLIAAIAQRGINPYAANKVYDFDQASRQDQIIAICAQCHSEYVGGYSANTGLDQDYFPWAKPSDLENQYQSLFGYLQDWTHGGPVAPWQSSNSNARGFFPYGLRFPISAPLIKVQHPEAETFFNSPMYRAGATCTDCHSTRISGRRMTGYTSHWFTSPLKLMIGFNGQTVTGVPITMQPNNPCRRCHMMETVAQSQQKIKTIQDNFYHLQEQTQVALVNALKLINGQPAGSDREANIKTYQQAAMRWEYYSQAENSMGFHNNPEAVTEVTNARLWVDAFVPWPLTPVNIRIINLGSNTLTLVFLDQAADETGFIIERGPTLEGPYTQVANILTPNGLNTGDVQWADTGLNPLTTYFYRVAAYNSSGVSIYSLWANGTTTAEAPATPAAPTNLVVVSARQSSIVIAWNDNSNNETGFYVERSTDGRTWARLATLGANTTSFTDSSVMRRKTYWYRVQAFNLAGRSGYSNVVSASPMCGGCR